MGVWEPFVYSGGVFTTFVGPTGSAVTEATGINDAGDIVGYWYSQTTRGQGHSWHGFLNSGGTFTALDYPGALNTNPLGVNNHGQVVGTFFDALLGQEQGFLYEAGAFSQLSYPGAWSTFAEGINDDGQVVGFYRLPSGIDHGFLYDNGAFTTIDDPTANAGTHIRGINDNRDMVGYSYHRIPSVPTDEPSSLVGLLSMVAGVAPRLGHQQNRHSAGGRRSRPMKQFFRFCA